MTDTARRERGQITAVCNISRVPSRALFIFGVNESNRGDGTRFERSGMSLADAMAARGTDIRIVPLPQM